MDLNVLDIMYHFMIFLLIFKIKVTPLRLLSEGVI